MRVLAAREGQEDDMKRKRHTPEQIVGHLREAEKLLAEGKTITQVIKKLGVTEQTYYRWKRDYAGASTDQMKKLRLLERENSELKKIVAEQTLDIRVLKDVAEGNF
jgi:putative transposase